MAKRRKEDGEPEEDYEFEVPDFDEDAFIHKEIVSFKTTGVLFLWGVLAAVVSWLLWSATGGDDTGWYIGLGVVALFAYGLRYLYPRLGIDISHFGRREWLGTGFLMFFTWLAFFMVLANPPIDDNEPPSIEVFASPEVQQMGGDVHLDVFYLDNAGVRDMAFEVRQGDTVIATLDDFTQVGEQHFEHFLRPDSGGDYRYVATAVDRAGHQTVANGTFRVSQQAMQLELPEGNRIDQAADTVFLRINDGLPPCPVDRGVARPARVEDRLQVCHVSVSLNFTDGRSLVMQHDPALGGWKATPNFAAWRPGNNTFSVVSIVHHHSYGPYVLQPAIQELAGPFTLDVTASIGAYEVEVPLVDTRPPNQVQTPGPEIAVVAVALLGAVAVARRRGKDPSS